MARPTGNLMKLKYQGFNGEFRGGLLVHPTERKVIYACGPTIIVEDVLRDQDYNSFTTLVGHTGDVNHLAVSSNGTYLASSQESLNDKTALIKVWDLKKRECMFSLNCYPVTVLDLQFSQREDLLFTMGGGSKRKLKVWRLPSGTLLVSHEVHPQQHHNIMAVTADPDPLIVTAGVSALTVWKIGDQNNKLLQHRIVRTQINTEFLSLAFVTDKGHRYCLAGSSRGAIFIVNMDVHETFGHCPILNRSRKGITALCVIEETHVKPGTCGDAQEAGESSFTIATGSEEGLVAYHRFELRAYPWSHASVVTMLGEVTSCQNWHAGYNRNSHSRITSIGIMNYEREIFVGTGGNRIAALDMHNLSATMTRDCHTKPINDLQFPKVLDPGKTEGRRPTGMQSLAETITGLGMISLVRVREDSKECIAMGRNGCLFLWNLETHAPRQVLFPNHGFQGVSYGGPRSHMVAVTEDSFIAQLDADSETITKCREVARDGMATALEVSKDWNVALCGQPDGTLQFHDFRCVEDIQEAAHGASIKMIRMCPKMEYIISVGTDGFFILWECPWGIYFRS